MIIGRFLSGRSLIDGSLFETPLSFPPAADHKGARRLGVDGFVYTSQRFPKDDSPYQWLSASQITAQSIRVIDEDSVTHVTVHPTSPSADFTTLAAACNYLSGFNPFFGTTPIQGSITLLAGMSLESQVLAAGVNLGWVELLSEDASVTVLEDAFTEGDFFSSDQFPLFSFIESQTPVMRVLFVSNGANSLNPARVTVGIKLRQSFCAVRPRPATAFTGFEGFHQNALLVSDGEIRGNLVSFKNAKLHGVAMSLGGSFSTPSGSDFSGCGTHAIFSITGGRFTVTTSGGGTNFRRSVGVDSVDDLRVESGGNINNRDTTALGGVSQPPGRLTNNGIIQDARVAFSAPYDRSNLLGTVSQTAGVPTGPVMQHGNSANGFFERRASGRAECTRTDQTTPNVSTAYGALFRSADIVWTFPTSFFAGTLPAVSFSADNPDVIGYRIISLSATSVTFQLVANASIAGTTTIRESAHGRWSNMA